MPLLSAAFVLCVAVFLAGCGQRGPLTLPSGESGGTVVTEIGEPAGNNDEEASGDDNAPQEG